MALSENAYGVANVQDQGGNLLWWIFPDDVTLTSSTVTGLRAGPTPLESLPGTATQVASDIIGLVYAAAASGDDWDTVTGQTGLDAVIFPGLSGSIS